MADGAVGLNANVGTSGLAVEVGACSLCFPKLLNPLNVGVDCGFASFDLTPNKLGVPAAPNMLGFVPLVDACAPGCDCEDPLPVLALNIEVGGWPAGVVDGPPKTLVLPAGAGVVEPPNKLFGADDWLGVPGVCVGFAGLLKRPPLGLAGASGLAKRPPPVAPLEALCWPNKLLPSLAALEGWEKSEGCGVEEVPLRPLNRFPVDFWLSEPLAALFDVDCPEKKLLPDPKRPVFELPPSFCSPLPDGLDAGGLPKVKPVDDCPKRFPPVPVLLLLLEPAVPKRLPDEGPEDPVPLNMLRSSDRGRVR